MKVLYIDDEVDLLDIAKGFFEEENIDVDTCSDFNEALKLAEQNFYDVIISDANMPSGSGLELFRILRNEMNYVGKLVIATGDLQKRDSQEIHGYDLAIYKPIDFFELIDNVRKLVE